MACTSRLFIIIFPVISTGVVTQTAASHFYKYIRADDDGAVVVEEGLLVLMMSKSK